MPNREDQDLASLIRVGKVYPHIRQIFPLRFFRNGEPGPKLNLRIRMLLSKFSNPLPSQNGHSLYVRIMRTAFQISPKSAPIRRPTPHSYNQKVKSAALLAIPLFALIGCANRNVDTLEAVKQGVIRDVGKNLNIGNMDVNVVSVSFRDKEADAVVSFTAKGAPTQTMTMNYTMERQGSEWHVKSRAGSDLQKHAAQSQPGSMGAAPMDGMHGQTQLPAGHPQMGDNNGTGAGKNLPPDHPPIDK